MTPWSLDRISSSRLRHPRSSTTTRNGSRRWRSLGAGDREEHLARRTVSISRPRPSRPAPNSLWPAVWGHSQMAHESSDGLQCADQQHVCSPVEPTRRHASPTSYAHPSRRLEVSGFAKSGPERSAGKEAQLTYIVNESCIRCKYMDCVEVCPVDCFYEGENMLVIHPDECIDCGVCDLNAQLMRLNRIPNRGSRSGWRSMPNMLRCGRTSPSNESRRQMPRTGRASLTRPSYCRQSWKRRLNNDDDVS